MIVRIAFLLILIIFSLIGYKITHIQNFSWDTAVADFFQKNYYGIPLFLIISLSMLFGALFIYITMFYSEIRHFVFKIKSKRFKNKVEKTKSLISMAENAYASYRFAEAYEHLKKAHKIFEEDFNIVYYLGRVCLKLEYWSEAEQFLKKSIELNPKYVDAYIKMATLYYNQKDYSSAKKYADIALQLDKKNIKAMFARRDIYEAINEYEKALDINKRILQLSQAPQIKNECAEHNLWLLSILCKREIEQGKYEKAITYAESLINSADYKEIGYEYLCLIYETRNPVKFEKVCADAFNATKNISFLTRLRDYYIRKEQPSKAINVFLSRITEKKEDLPLKIELARTYFCLGNKEALKKTLADIKASDESLTFKEPLRTLFLKTYLDSNELDKMKAFVDGENLCAE